MRALLAGLLLCVGLGTPFSHAQRAGPQVQVLHDSRMQVALCSATMAVRVVAEPLEPDSTESLLNPDLRMEIERVVLGQDGLVERRTASIRPGILACFDDYIANYVPSVSGHFFPRFLRWPRDAERPIDLGGAPDLSMSGPGIVFVPHYPSETVKESRARMTGAGMSPGMALILPEGLPDWPDSSVRAGTSPTGAPLLLATQRSFYGNFVGIGIIETGRDPVAVHGAELKIDGVTEKLQAAVLSTWGSRPALRFAYRVPADDFNTLVVGAATCDPPRALSDDVVMCRPLARMRVPSSADNFSQAKEAERASIAVAEGGTRVFVLTNDPRRWCLRVAPVDGSTVAVAAAGVCAFEMPGAARALAAVSDDEVLVLATEGDKMPTYRLLRVRGLTGTGLVRQTGRPAPDPARPDTTRKDSAGAPSR